MLKKFPNNMLCSVLKVYCMLFVFLFVLFCLVLCHGLTDGINCAF